MYLNLVMFSWHHPVYLALLLLGPFRLSVCYISCHFISARRTSRHPLPGPRGLVPLLREGLAAARGEANTLPG